MRTGPHCSRMAGCGCGAIISHVDKAKQEQLKSDWHVQWEKAWKTQRPHDFPKAKPVEASSSSNANRNPGTLTTTAVQAVPAPAGAPAAAAVAAIAV